MLATWCRRICGCRIDVADGIATRESMTGTRYVFWKECLELAFVCRDAACLEARAGSNIFVAEATLCTTSQESRNGTVDPAVVEICVPSITRVVAHGENERIRYNVVIYNVKIESILLEQMGKSGWMRSRARAVLDVVERVHDMRGWICRIEVLSVPAVRKVNGSVEPVHFLTVVDTSWEAATCALIHSVRSVADPLCNVLQICLRRRRTQSRISCKHSEAVRELEWNSLCPGAGIFVV